MAQYNRVSVSSYLSIIQNSCWHETRTRYVVDEIKWKGTLGGVAFREVEEEIGLDVRILDLTRLNKHIKSSLPMLSSAAFRV